jgi:type IV fimbrial biogenesis protein FimT
MQNEGKSQRGVTLVEACLVAAISAVALSAAAPGLRALIAAKRLDGIATHLAADLQYARTEAVARNEPVRISFYTDAAGSCYVLHTGARALCSCAAPGPASCGAGAVQIKSVYVPAGQQVGVQANVSSILFDPLHGTSSPTGTVRAVAASGASISHVVNVMGRVRTCSPDGVVSGYRAC